MSDFPNIEKFVAACNTAYTRHVQFAHALMLGRDYIEVDGMRQSIDKDFMREVEPEGVRSANRFKFLTEVLVVNHARLHEQVELPYRVLRGMRFERYVLMNYTVEECNILKQEILAAHAQGAHLFVLEGLEHFDAAVKAKAHEVTAEDNTTTGSAKL